MCSEPNYALSRRNKKYDIMVLVEQRKTFEMAQKEPFNLFLQYSTANCNEKKIQF